MNLLIILGVNTVKCKNKNISAAITVPPQASGNSAPVPQLNRRLNEGTPLLE